MTNWHEHPIQPLPINRLVWPCHDINPDHVHPHDGRQLTTGPIHVQQLLDGSLYIHDGRHRAIRAQLRGDTHIDGRIA